jgi:GTP-binding protein HflX
MDHIRGQLEAVRRTRRQQRQRRETVPVPTVALVGYTNAGKSTLFNALTQAGVLESKRMFATLDPKLRAIMLPSRRRVLLADTVGFVRQLPHTLVTSFRATLEEVEQAEVLIHVRDASSPTLERQKEDVETVLGELGAGSKPRIEVLNKADLLKREEAEILRQREPGIFASGLRKTGVAELLTAVEAALHSDPMQQAWFRIPQSEGRVLAALDAGAMVLRREFAGEHTLVEVSGPVSLLGRYRKYRLGAPPKVARGERAKPARKVALRR